jgi:citrate lyase subunit beta/citryl-CoA lyase
MSKTLRPRRSVLYMPGANTRALEKARTLPADALIFDLEDAVAPDAKDAARTNVVLAAESKAYGRREIVIRCNGIGTTWGEADIAAIAKSGADAILVPKVESAAEVTHVVSLLDTAGAPPSLAVWAMMETPKGILRAEEIAGSHPRLGVFVMGTNDLMKDMRAQHTPTRLPLITALGIGMLAARAYGLAVLDGVYNDIKDVEGFRAVCRQGVEMGFDGKTLIHPGQIEPCNEIFAPSAEELAMAGKIVAALKLAQAEGKGVVTIDGRMIENLHVEQAERALKLAEAIEQLQAAA